MAPVFNHGLLLKARLELDMTQEQVAAAVGVDVRTYRRYESGAVNDPRLGFSVRSPTRRRMLERLSAELGVAEAELLTDANAAAPAPAPLEMARGARVLGAFAAGDDPLRSPAHLPFAAQAALLYEQGLYAGALGDLAFACRCYEAYCVLVEEPLDPLRLATGLRTLSYTQRLRGELSSARRNVERSVAVAERAGHADHAARGVALLAAVLHDQGEIEAADARFASLDAMGDARVARRGLWQAEHDLALGRRAEARAATLQDLSICERLGWEGHVAHCHAVLGFAAVEDDADAAEPHLARARAWAGATGEVEMVLRCHELAARIALARGLLDEGAREAATGLALAETCGYGPFRARLGSLAARCALPGDLAQAEGTA